MSVGISCIEKTQSPIGYSDTTGLQVYESYLAPSGFNYMVGIREIKDLLIVEQIAEGTGCTYLCGILIYHKDSTQLMKEISVERNVRYTRTQTMQLVSESLLELLLEASQKEDIIIDLESAKEFISDILDKCYFETSRKTILIWAKSVGIIPN